MEARMTHPAFVVPGAMPAMQALSEAIHSVGLSTGLLEILNLRASQINGCSVCTDMHWRIARKAGESDDRLFAVGAWRETPYFTDAERAALALTECMTRLADKADPVPDDVWEDVASHYKEDELAALLLSIGLINIWNRLNAATKQPVGAWKP
jgi:AhpD family alkylhydroperoxidase